MEKRDEFELQLDRKRAYKAVKAKLMAEMTKTKAEHPDFQATPNQLTEYGLDDLVCETRDAA